MTTVVKRDFVADLTCQRVYSENWDNLNIMNMFVSACSLWITPFRKRWHSFHYFWRLKRFWTTAGSFFSTDFPFIPKWGLTEPFWRIHQIRKKTQPRAVAVDSKGIPQGRKTYEWGLFLGRALPLTDCLICRQMSSSPGCERWPFLRPNGLCSSAGG